MSNLYIVGTPIGNLEDITLRALRILAEVDVIASEDTRETRKILAKYNISKPLISYHARSKYSRTAEIGRLLAEGKDIAVVTCAGTPGISDPGTALVAFVRKELSDVKVVAVPGPSAVVSALSISGLPTDEFVFLGFLPHKKGREKLFKNIATTKMTTVFYESPHRFMKMLESLRLHCSDRKVGIAREMTKIYEDFRRGTPEQLIAYFTEHKDQVRGEFVVIVSGL